MNKQPVYQKSAPNKKSVQNKKQAKKQSKKKFYLLIIAAIVVISGITVAALSTPPAAAPASQAAADDLVIPISGISSTATFYPTTVNGTKIEVLAVKAPDGTIRTAFNTCQVCYSSGRGYYEQSGDVLVCQNCGNRFKMSAVEVEKGGCNPVPIMPENKTVDASNITISAAYLKQAAALFQNWKAE